MSARLMLLVQSLDSIGKYQSPGPPEAWNVLRADGSAVMVRKPTPQLELEKIRPVRLFERVAEQIRAQFIEGHLRPGDRLPSELELSEALEVSRASVRETPRWLKSKGLIEVRSGAGAFVTARPFSFAAPSEAMEWLVSPEVR